MTVFQTLAPGRVCRDEGGCIPLARTGTAIPLQTARLLQLRPPPPALVQALAPLFQAPLARARYLLCDPHQPRSSSRHRTDQGVGFRGETAVVAAASVNWRWVRGQAVPLSAGRTRGLRCHTQHSCSCRAEERVASRSDRMSCGHGVTVLRGCVLTGDRLVVVLSSRLRSRSRPSVGCWAALMED